MEIIRRRITFRCRERFVKANGKSGKLTMKIPRVFISYTHENAAHKAWVLKLARDLRSNGIDAILDQWECKLGSDLTLFMERGIERADRVVLICTPAYKKKANYGKGGVGYERMVVTWEIARNIKTSKFISVLRVGSQKSSIPTFGSSRLYIDFRDDSKYAFNLEELLRDIHVRPMSPKPPVGPNPFQRKAARIRVTRTPPTKSAKAKPPIGSNPFLPSPKAETVAPPIQAHPIDDRPLRRRMRETRTAVNHKFDIAGHEGFLTVGLFDDSQPGEIQIRMAKESSTVAGLMDTIAILTSLALQYGVPLEVLVRKFTNMHYEPSGYTKNPEIRQTSSISDYVFRWMAMQFVPGYREANSPRVRPEIAMPGLLEELKRKINRPVPELPIE
jgi:hypothetical protein